MVLDGKHLADGMEGAEVNSVCHTGVETGFEGFVCLACDSDIEERGHKAGNVLRHSAANGENEGVASVTETAIGHYLQVADGLLQQFWQMVGIIE